VPLFFVVYSQISYIFIYVNILLLSLLSETRKTSYSDSYLFICLFIYLILFEVGLCFLKVLLS